MEVKSGTADVALVDSVCALGMVGEGTDYEDLVINMDNNFGQQEYGIAFRKGSDVTEKVLMKGWYEYYKNSDCVSNNSGSLLPLSLYGKTWVAFTDPCKLD